MILGLEGADSIISNIMANKPQPDQVTVPQLLQKLKEDKGVNSGNIISEMERGDGVARKFKEADYDDKSIDDLLKSFIMDDNTENFYHHGRHGDFDVVKYHKRGHVRLNHA